jgi:hypothetical protein
MIPKIPDHAPHISWQNEELWLHKISVESKKYLILQDIYRFYFHFKMKEQSSKIINQLYYKPRF